MHIYHDHFYHVCANLRIAEREREKEKNDTTRIAVHMLCSGVECLYQKETALSYSGLLGSVYAGQDVEPWSLRSLLALGTRRRNE
jgi:hypothetical protein